MATKWRSFSTNMVVKAIAFVLTVLLLSGSMVMLLYANFMHDQIEPLLTSEYKMSETFLHDDVLPGINAIQSVLVNGAEAPTDVPYSYYATNGSTVWTNTGHAEKDFYTQFDVYYAFENGKMSYKNDTYIHPHISLYGVKPEMAFYLAFPDKYMAGKQSEWNVSRRETFTLVLGIAINLLLALTFIGVLLYGTGRKSDREGLHLSAIDNLYTDIQVLIAGMIGLFWSRGITGFRDIPWNTSGILTASLISQLIIAGLFTSVTAALGGILLLSFARKIKGKRLLKHTLVFTLIFLIYDFFRSLFDGRRFEKYPLTKSLFYRQLAFLAISFVLVFFTIICILRRSPLALLPPLLELPMLYWFIKGNGNTFDEINKGFRESLDEQMRAERMKVELITNVSHDLKTPLTSIISFIDLLGKEEGLSDPAKDYVKILTEKSDRLHHLISDLFELAKSTTGDVKLEREDLDLKKLIEQTLADMESEISASGLQLRTNMPEQAVIIRSDGKRLYRVFQNMVDNALKYSLKGTRIYIDLERKGSMAVAIIKNTAGYEMNFTPTEILQRFSRGDQSRSTEGSGLGLSIAESFTLVCGGKFKVDIDGDLFKVTITMPIKE